MDFSTKFPSFDMQRTLEVLSSSSSSPFSLLWKLAKKVAASAKLALVEKRRWAERKETSPENALGEWRGLNLWAARRRGRPAWTRPAWASKAGTL